MRHNDVVFLLSKKVTYDELGNAIETDEERMVYANEMAVSMKEFYHAGKNIVAGNIGLRPEKQFEVYAFEYTSETHLLHNEQKYKIIRTQTKGEKTRLVCERMIK